VSLRGVIQVAAVELAKLRARRVAALVLTACVLAPFAFVLVLRHQAELPEDTLFGRSVKDSGFAIPLFVLGFAGQWALPAVGCVIAGDILAGEDRHGTWPSLLTRSRTRGEVFVGKALVAIAFSVAAVALLGASSLAAGIVGVGRQPLVGLSGNEIAPGRAALLVALAWASALPPVLGFTAIAMALSAVTRSSTAGVGLPVLGGFLMELTALVDGPEVARRLLLSTGFGAWHGLFADPPFQRPLVHGALVGATWAGAGFAIAWASLRGRDLGA